MGVSQSKQMQQTNYFGISNSVDAVSVCVCIDATVWVSYIFSALVSLFLAGSGLLTYVVVLIMLVILIWGPAQSHTYRCPVVGLPITISPATQGVVRTPNGTESDGMHYNVHQCIFFWGVDLLL